MQKRVAKEEQTKRYETCRRKKQTVRYKSNYIDRNTKYEWTYNPIKRQRFFFLKAEIVRLDKKQD